MERREARFTELNQISRQARRGTNGESKSLGSKKWFNYALHAQDIGLVFTTPFNLIDEETLRAGHQSLAGNKAPGVDGISKREFAEKLDDNITQLSRELHQGVYRPMAKRQTLIPKANGKLRPIAISTFRDKIVEWSVAKVLNLAFEPLFIRNSYGFRPNRSAHDAIEATYMILKDDKRPWVVEIDFESFFNTVPHQKLMELVQRRIKDRRLLGLIARLLKCEIISLKERYQSREGTPQGSVASPVLANIYLHYVLDEWFVANFASQKAQMVRYADDAVFMFATKDQADSFMEALQKRVADMGLRLNADKTRLIDFTQGKGDRFDFLGFTFVWGKRAFKRRSSLKVKTQKDRLFKKVEEFKIWIKKARSRMRTGKLLDVVSAKLRGHYNYYGYKSNREKLTYFYWLVLGLTYKWLNRRSQKQSYGWNGFKALISTRLPEPPAMEKLKPLGVKYAR
jgi:group II intron reverse transcriptase/maturase